VHQVHQHPLSTNRTLDSNSFRLRRRDLASPNSELAGSASESEAGYSYSCDTLGSASDAEFPDLHSVGGFLRLGSLSIAREMHTSPDLGPALDTSKPTSGRPDSAVETRSGESSPRCPSIPVLGGGAIDKVALRFPVYDSTDGLHDEVEFIPIDPRKDTIIGIAQAAWKEPSPFEQVSAGPPSVVPPLSIPSIPNILRRKRQLSSRRALVSALREGEIGSSRSVDLSSARSLQELMPVRKGARHGGSFQMDLESENIDRAPISGPPTQRSSRGGNNNNISLQPTSGLDAAAAAAHMTTMTLQDENDKE
jgi:hypothetical protein